MVEVSRDGRRVYVTNSLYRTWDEQFYPDGIRGWMAKLDAEPNGGIDARSRTSCSSPTACGRTRSGSKAATPLRLVLLRVRSVDMSELSRGRMLTALGAFHGVNPGMGWLFAVALGMQERRRGAVSRRCVPLGLGHALAVGAAVTLAASARRGPSRRAPCGGLSARGCWCSACCACSGTASAVGQHAGRLRRLTLWSFLMASAHGAGLMVVPVFLGMAQSPLPADGCHTALATGGTMSAAIIATALHATGYLAVTAIVAVVVFEKFGVGLLRKAWLNLDVLWAAALIGTGVLTFLI